MNKKLLASALLLVASTTITLAAAPGFYVAGQVGYGKTNYSIGDFASSTPSMISASINNTGASGRLFGGYQFNDNWAAELGYNIFKKAQFSSIVTSAGPLADGGVNVSAWDLVGRGIYPLDNGVAVFAKAGFAYTRASTTGGLDTAYQMKITKWRPVAGVGVSYDFTPNVSADLSFTRIFKGSGIENADATAIGLSYHFG